MSKTQTTLATLAALALAGSIAACGGSAPLTQANANAGSPNPNKATTCDVAREALLTGTPAEITKAMKKLIADKKAPAVAREYASYYTVRDAKDPQLQEMDKGLIQTACTV